MRTTVKLAATVLIGISLTGVAQGQPKLNCTKDVKFGQAFLAKFPDAGAACQEVKVVQGEKWVRFDAPLTFEYTPDATLTLENKQVKAASAVKKGNKVMVWVPESRFGIYAQPGDVESKQFKVVSAE